MNVDKKSKSKVGMGFWSFFVISFFVISVFRIKT